MKTPTLQSIKQESAASTEVVRFVECSVRLSSICVGANAFGHHDDDDGDRIAHRIWQTTGLDFVSRQVTDI